jgi:hypothetical protein
VRGLIAPLSQAPVDRGTAPAFFSDAWIALARARLRPRDLKASMTTFSLFSRMHRLEAPSFESVCVGEETYRPEVAIELPPLRRKFSKFH